MENRYAAITLDPFLPEDGGFALICKLRKEEGFPSIPIIIITAGANEDEIELNGLTPDIVDWIRKPVDNLRLAASIEKAVQNVAGKRKKILHVEDDSDLVYLTTELVSDFGDVVHAPSLAVAKRLLREEKFDLILLDLGMPDGNGLELLSDLHQHDSRGVPVVVFSAHEMDPADAARVNAALVKSKDTYEDLVARVRSLVAQNREN